MADDWTTRVLPELAAQYGMRELHTAWFLPKGWPGRGPVVGLLIPECEMQVVFLAPDGEPVAVINRPKINRNVKSWLRHVCETAKDMGASVALACDTAEQAERAARMAGRFLPNHERIALERMHQADTRARQNLN
jgi:hypothetical protein